MIRHLRQFLEVVTALAALGGIGYYGLCLYALRKFLDDLRAKSSNSTSTLNGISILKPLRGTDPEMYASFLSHCVQDFTHYEIIFGVSDPADPAVALVQRLMRDFPNVSLKLIVCDRALGTNMKVSNLVQMLPHARHDLLIVNDSDIKVDPSYLRDVSAPFAKEHVGMVTCLYRGIASNTLGSRLEALGISTDFSAGVLSARALEGIHFGLGSTLAFRRAALDKIGGFQVLLDYLADDYELGARIATAGYDVVLSDVVVDHHLPEYSVRDFVAHQLRWARSVRDSRKWGYAGVGLTFALPWAVLSLLFSKGALWSWLLLAMTLGFRYAVAFGVGVRFMRDRQVLRDFWLIPLRDLVALLVWIASFAGHTIEWRGDQFILKDGKLHPA